MLAVNGRTIVAKLGAHGAAAREAGRPESVTRAAVPISVIDTVGAGDAFVAGYLAEPLAGHGLGQCLDTAVKTGAFACLSAGDWEGLPTRGQLGLLGASEGVVR